jgi:hypothetical protein
MRLRTAPLLVATALAIAGCSSVPSYEGGPTLDDPYGIIQPEDNVKLWTIDGKPAFNRDQPTYVSPGSHKLVFRINYPIDDESQFPQEYIDQPLTVEEGLRYRFMIHGEFERGPPYELEQKVTKIRGYGSS